MDDDKAMQKAYWTSASGDKWALMADRIDGAHAGVTAALAEAARPGERVLDVGCGAGTTLRALQARGVSDLTGIDIAPALLAAAKEAAPGARLVEADAQDHDFEPGSYDVVLSQFGVMFFSDSVAAFKNLRRATRPGGRLVMYTWQARERNPWFEVPNMAVEAETGPLGGDPDAPGPTRFRDIARVNTILSEAGWSDVSGEEVVIPLTPPGAMEDAVEQVMAMGPAARALAGDAVDDAGRDRIRATIAASFAAFLGADGRVRVPGALNRFTATAP